MRIQYIILFFWTISLKAQVDSNIVIQEINEGPIKIFSLSEELSVQNFGKEALLPYQGASVADLLQRESGVFVKQYGLGMLGTVSNRGSGAAHTAILWEGTNILNPMLGQSDLSLLPVLFMDEISLRNGGSSALDGNNAIGGSLNMRTKTAFNSGLGAMAQFQLGSFGDIRQQLKLSYGTKKYAGSIRAFYQRANNNFKYRDNNAFGNPKPWVRQTNAQQESYGILQENSLRIAKNNIVDLKNWFQKSFRQIPPNLLQTLGDREEQKDLSFRNILSWTHLNPSQGHSIHFKNAFIYETLDYESQVLQSDSRMFSNTSSVKFLKILSAKISSHEKLLSISFNHQYQSANSSSYQKGQHQLGLSADYTLEQPKFIINFIARSQWVDGSFLRPAADINGRFKLLDKQQQNGQASRLLLQAAISYNYRYPTLNDRFWQPGGNPYLLPEYALSSDLALRLEQHWAKGLSQNLSLGAFSNYVENWIQWSPETSSGLWTPQNIATVWARGMELKWDMVYQRSIKSPISISFGSSYFLNFSQRVKDIDLALANKQLIYTPQHSVLGRFNFHYKNCSLQYRHNFNGKRYLDNANTEWLPSYQLGWLQGCYFINIKKIKIAIQASIDNVWGTEYQVVANRAMPRQNFQIGLMFSYL